MPAQRPLEVFALVIDTPKRGRIELMLDSNRLSRKACFEAADAVAEFRYKSNDMAEEKYPMNEGESVEDWRKRCGKDLDNDFMMRRENESIKDHVLRLSRPLLNAHECCLYMINWWGLKTGQLKEPLTEEDLENAVHQRIRETLYKFFVVNGEVAVTELYPKS